MRVAPIVVAYAALGALGVYLAWRVGGKARELAAELPSVGAVLDAINPASPENVVYRGVSAATEAATGDPSFGGWLYDITHPGPYTRPPAPAPTAPGDPAEAHYRSPTPTDSLTHPTIAPPAEGVRPGGDPYNGHPMPEPYYPWMNQ